MKTKTKLLALILCASAFFNANVIFSQCISPIKLAGPPRYELQPPSSYFFTVTNGTANCGTPAIGTNSMPGMGINVISPAYELDILCDPSSGTNSDINISTTNATQNVGYRIGGNRGVTQI